MRFFPQLSILFLFACELLTPFRGVGEETLRELKGNAATLMTLAAGKVRVFIFIRKDCPVSNAYAPEVARLVADFEPKGAAFWLVYPDPDEVSEQVHKHLQAFDFGCPALLDPAHELVARAGAMVTPEGAVFSRDGKLLYCGRIDDRYLDYGHKRARTQTHDLANAITAALANQQVPRPTGAAVGCLIEDLKK
jgi:hypothetical protein